MAQNPTAVKTCPFCAERIQDAAIVCKHCRRDLVSRSSWPAPATVVGVVQAFIVFAVVVVPGFQFIGFAEQYGTIAKWTATGIVVVTACNAWRWWLGWRGLDQWPEPYGRYYNRWLDLPRESGGDYYPWLADQMGHKEPWRSWVEKERLRELQQHSGGPRRSR